MLPPWAAFRPIGGWAWTRPGAVRLASTAPGHPASNRQLGPGPPPRSRERESCEAPGGSSRSRLVLALGCEAARQTAMARIVERNIHHRFLFSSSTNNLQLLSPDLTDLLYRFNSTKSSFHFKGTSKDCERIRRPSRSACLRRFVKLVPLPWRVSDMSGDEKCPRVECHTSHFSKIFAR